MKRRRSATADDLMGAAVTIHCLCRSTGTPDFVGVYPLAATYAPWVVAHGGHPVRITVAGAELPPVVLDTPGGPP